MIGNQIKRVLKMRGKSQLELAEELKLSRQAVSSMLDNDHINTEYLMKISVFLNYDFFMLYSAEIPNTEKPPIPPSLIPSLESELAIFLEKIKKILSAR